MSQEISTFSRTIAAPAAQLYRAFTNSTALREWLCDSATIARRPGGHIFLAWNDGYFTAGEYTALEENARVAFTWRGNRDPGPTAVEVTLQPDGDGTRLTVNHNGLGSGPEWERFAQEMTGGWQYSLENLESVLTEGPDLRLVQRPMLGISLSDFNQQIAGQLGVPVHDGVRIDGVLSGMGAEAAGLQADDVLVGINDTPVRGFTELTSALQRQRAGDTVQVTFYRGPEKQETAMTLSGRPVPDIPWDLEELAGRIAAANEETNQELTSFLAEVSEEEAGYRPASDAWSVKETLAHLIHSERGWHTFISELADGYSPLYDDFGGNLLARVSATAAAYGTTEALLEALRQAQRETVALIRHLPAGFLDRKGSYWQIAFSLLQDPLHHQTHMEQMQSAVQAARENR